MSLNIDATWYKPLVLKDGNADNLIYSCPKFDSVPEAAGVYIFGREYGDAIFPLYIGRSTNLRLRLEQHLEHSVRLMNNIQKAPAGTRFFLFCTVSLKRGQKEESVLQTLESALISHALAEGHQLLNEQGTRRPNHTIRFKGNRTSEAIAPRFMRVRSL